MRKYGAALPALVLASEKSRESAHPGLIVTPVNPGSWSGAGTGVHQISNSLDSGFRRNDGVGTRRRIYEMFRRMW